MSIDLDGCNKEPYADFSETESLVRLEHVTRMFGEIVAVDDVALSIRKREIFALIGGSGSGKSTLLRMLAGFETPTKGSIYLDGEDITSLPPYMRPINMMFQSYALFPHMTVEQNVAFGLKQDRMKKDQIAQRVKSMLNMVHMNQYASRKPHQLSSGQRQRVALARSLAKRPKLLLLDEPMGALDKKLRSRMQLEIVDIIKEVGVTCLMVTHDQEEAMAMADRIGIMDCGWIVQVGTPVDIYETPNSRMIAEFVGSVNMFEGEIVEEAADHVVIHSPCLEALIYVGHGITTSLEKRKVWYAIRPEKTLISTTKPVEYYNWTSGTVIDIAYLGAHSVYHIKLPSGMVIQTNMVNIERSADNPTLRDKVYIKWDSNSGVVLNS